MEVVDFFLQVLDNDNSQDLEYPNLHRMCECMQFSKFPQGRVPILERRTDRTPEAARTLDPFDLLPLHWACQNPHITKEALLHLINLHPQGVSQSAGELAGENSGKYPLHLLAGRSIEIVQLIYEKFPAAVSEVSSSSDLPFHCAIRENKEEEGAVVTFLHQKYPAASSPENNSHNLINLAGASFAPVKVFEFLESLLTPGQAEQAFSEVGRKRQMALHRLFMRWDDTVPTIPAAPLELVKYITKKADGALQHKNRDEQLPLHLACSYNVTEINESVISFLIDLYPEAVGALD